MQPNLDVLSGTLVNCGEKNNFFWILYYKVSEFLGVFELDLRKPFEIFAHLSATRAMGKQRLL